MGQVSHEDRIASLAAADAKLGPLTFDRFQVEQAEWAARNFGPESMTYGSGGLFVILEMAAELGRIAHAHLKTEQNIRTSEDHVAMIAEAAANLRHLLAVYLSSSRVMPKRERYAVPGALQLLGIIEEVGELAGVHEAHESSPRVASDPDMAAGYVDAARDGLGDLHVYLADYATRRGWSLAAVVSETWNHVKKRDWLANPSSGEAP